MKPQDKVDFKTIIDIQNRQLEEWKQLLQPKVYLALRIYAKKDNHKAITPFSICRGNSLDNFVCNFLLYERENNLEEVLGVCGWNEYQSECRCL